MLISTKSVTSQKHYLLSAIIPLFMQQKPLKLKINIYESWRSEFFKYIYHSKSMHLYTVHVLHVCVFTYKNIEGLSQYSFHSEIYCMFNRLHCIRNEQNSLHI